MKPNLCILKYCDLAFIDLNIPLESHGLFKRSADRNFVTTRNFEQYGFFNLFKNVTNNSSMVPVKTFFSNKHTKFSDENDHSFAAHNNEI